MFYVSTLQKIEEAEEALSEVKRHAENAHCQEAILDIDHVITGVQSLKARILQSLLTETKADVANRQRDLEKRREFARERATKLQESSTP